jgi:hypothetical protein
LSDLLGQRAAQPPARRLAAQQRRRMVVCLQPLPVETEEIRTADPIASPDVPASRPIPASWKASSEPRAKYPAGVWVSQTRRNASPQNLKNRRQDGGQHFELLCFNWCSDTNRKRERRRPSPSVSSSVRRS